MAESEESAAITSPEVGTESTTPAANSELTEPGADESTAYTQAEGKKLQGSTNEEGSDITSQSMSTSTEQENEPRNKVQKQSLQQDERSDSDPSAAETVTKV